MRTASLVLILLAAASPLSADWLVGRDGSRVETRGPWRVKGSQVLFTLPSGTLSSMRLSQLDLEASRRATEAAAAPLVTVVPPLRRSVLVLDGRSIPKAAVVEPEKTGEEVAPEKQTETESSADAKTDSGPVEVVFWQEKAHPDRTGVEITGTLRNYSSQIATGLGLTVSLVDTAGQTLRTASAFVDTASLAARSTTSFRAMFSDVVGLEADPRFRVTSRVLEFEASPTEREEP